MKGAAKIALCLAVAALAASRWPFSRPALAVPDRAATGAIAGRIRVLGRLKRVKGSLNPYAAAGDALDGKTKPSAHLVVFLEDDLGRSPAANRKEALCLEDRQFATDMVPVLPGQEVEFLNRDRACHSLFSFSELKEFRLGRMGFGEGGTVKFPKAPVSGIGVVNVFCELHPEERAYVLVMPNPYWTLVGLDQAREPKGAPFRLEGLPARFYTLTSWQPSLEAVPMKVRVTAGAVTAVDLVMKGDE